jgi:hypothetical protein
VRPDGRDAEAAMALGFSVDVDFVATSAAVTWFIQNPPSQAALDAVDLSEAAIAAREDAKEPLLADLKAQAAGAIADNNAFIAIASPTNAQTLAQVKKLTQQNNRIIRSLYRVIQRTWRNGSAAP